MKAKEVYLILEHNLNESCTFFAGTGEIQYVTHKRALELIDEYRMDFGFQHPAGYSVYKQGSKYDNQK
jgi:hypothetical protein